MNADAVPLIAVVGATGTGKSDLALNVAELIARQGGHAEIVGADASQLYRSMDIGTAKLSLDERRGIPHHLIDVLDVDQEASVAEYQAAARTAIQEIAARGAVPIMVGGSGLYVSSVLFDFQFPATDPAVRERLETELAEQGPGALFRRLQQVDPDAAASIGPHNGRRIVRALEVCEITGEPFGAGLPKDDLWWPDTRILGLSAERPVLVERLDSRVVQMWEKGLVGEVQNLLASGRELGVTAQRAIGYAQAIAQVNGELSEDDAIAQTQALTRRYARRQVGWFRRYRQAVWLEHDSPTLTDEALAAVGFDTGSDPISLTNA